MGNFRLGGDKIISTSSTLSTHEKLVKIFNDIFNEQVGKWDSLSFAHGLNITASIGYFRGFTSSNKISLPIETDVVLQENPNVIFNSKVPQDILNALYTRVFAGRSQQFELKPLAERVEVLENNPNTFHTIVYKSLLNRNSPYGFDWTKCVRRTISTCSVYRPANYHYKITVDKDELLNDSEQKLLCNNYVVKLFKPYEFRVSKGFGPIWRLCVVEVFEQVDDEDIMQLFSNDTKNDAIKSHEMDNDNDVNTDKQLPNKLIEIIQNLTQYHSIELYLDSKNLLKQWKRLQLEQINRFTDLIWMYERNIISLTNIFTSIHCENSENEFGSGDFYPFLFGDHSQEIRFHYDTKRVLKQQGSAIESLRKHNNMVKRGLIYVFVKKNSRVLDLACGRGQDLDKYSSVGINYLVGIDISSREIQEARRRFNQRKNSFSFTAEFHHGNLLDSKTYTSFLSGKKFSLISIQLAVHYLISTIDSLNLFLNNILNYMSEDGYFIGSTVMVERLVDGLVDEVCGRAYIKGNSISFGNSIYNITFSSDTMEQIASNIDLSGPSETVKQQLSDYLNNTFSIAYTFSLIESIDANEYVLPWKRIVNVASQMNLKLVCDSSFDEYFDYLQIETKSGKPVYQDYQLHLKRLKKNPLSHEEIEVFRLYKVFVFKRLSEVDRSYLGGVSIRKP
ncbi:mRNA (guanine-N7-)-methyltransferase [Babesia microti strain RI]|uniref:mRNA (guanine-N(7))-methyltransferase n=1 Tax=Babesia microti (strain RI) TaxID=1133968 RepID=A0A0K3ARY2_BABMR|nr:mRNA (guanine-N7-)-methyltransferase [Babesia microti strain RI]CTQ41220.1 mRNA (guanine-N7-)-methyltransferase [Babesia microti strain RI]|eukprot:XP_012649231.1 mRNA (guanine-N7-)-methyltransferase [Babesia microti strain RI]